MEVEVHVLGSPSLIVCTVCVDVTTLNLTRQSVRRIAELVPTHSLSGRVERRWCRRGECGRRTDFKTWAVLPTATAMVTQTQHRQCRSKTCRPVTSSTPLVAVSQ